MIIQCLVLVESVQCREHYKEQSKDVADPSH